MSCRRFWTDGRLSCINLFAVSKIYTDNCFFSSSSKFGACLCLYVNFIPSFHFPPKSEQSCNCKIRSLLLLRYFILFWKRKASVTPLASWRLEMPLLVLPLGSGWGSRGMPSLWACSWNRGTSFTIRLVRCWMQVRSWISQRMVLKLALLYTSICWVIWGLFCSTGIFCHLISVIFWAGEVRFRILSVDWAFLCLHRT